MPSADKRARKKENARAAQREREAALQRKKRIRSIITVVVIVAIFAVVLLIISTGKDDKKKGAGSTTTTAPVVLPAGCTKEVPPQTEKKVYKKEPGKVITDNPNVTYYADVSTTCGDFTMALNVRDAPETVNSFVYLAQQKFYDGLKFHRIAKDFIIQGGDPKGDGTGGPGYTIPDEPPQYGYREGTVAMANGGSGSTGSQFFIVMNDAAGKTLEGQGTPYKYSALGQVTKNFDVVKKLASLYNRDQDPADTSTQKTAVPLYINSVKITRVPPA